MIPILAEDDSSEATVKVNDHWAGDLSMPADFAGGILAASIIVLVAGLAVWGGIAMFKPQLKTEMFTKIMGVIAAAAGIGIIASSIAWVSTEMPSTTVAVPKTEKVEIKDRSPKDLQDKVIADEMGTDSKGHKGADQMDYGGGNAKAPKNSPSLKEQMEDPEGAKAKKCQEPDWHKGSGLPWDEEACKKGKAKPPKKAKAGADELPGAASQGTGKADPPADKESKSPLEEGPTSPEDRHQGLGDGQPPETQAPSKGDGTSGGADALPGAG